MIDRQPAQLLEAKTLADTFNATYDLVQLRIEPVVGLSDREITDRATREPGWYTAANLFGVVRLRDPTHHEAIATGQRLGVHPHVGARKKHGSTTLWRLDIERAASAD